MINPELSFLAPQNFYLQIDDLKDVAFFCQQVQLPSLTGGEVLLSNRLNSSKTFVPGDGLDYGTLDVTFIVDKNLTNYRSILSWLKRINSPDTQEQFNYNKFSETMSNINLICTDAAQEPLAEWKFKDAFPIGLDGFTFDASVQDIEYITANVSFRFLYFESLTYNNGALLDSVI